MQANIFFSHLRSYRPLVKHFDPNDENYGFDLSRVKMEPGKLAIFISLVRQSERNAGHVTSVIF